MLIAISLLLPAAMVAVIAAAGIFGPERGRRLRRGTALLSPLAVLPAVVLALFPPPSVEIPWLLFGTTFAVDAAGRSLTLIAALLYGAGLMAVTWVKLRDAEHNLSALSAFILVCFTGNIGTYLAADAASFYLSFTVMSFAAAGLVIHYRDRAAHRATRVYLVLSMISETAILAGLVLMISSGGYLLADAQEAVASSNHTGLIIALLLIGFGVKAGTVPLHVWLPLAHPAAPPAASAVLSGAMVKAGLIGMLRFFPSEHIGDDAGQQAAQQAAHPGGEALHTSGMLLLVLALLGAFAAVAVGVLQQDPKVILAYSTISQMGFMTALVAVGMIAPELAATTTAAALVYAVHHGLAKGALFIGVPVVKHYAHGLSAVLVVIGMAGAGLAVAGAPLTSGAYGKYVSKEAVADISVLGIGLDQILPLVATGSTLLLMRFAFVMWHSEKHPRRAPDGELVSWLILCAAGVVVPWIIGPRWLPQAGDFSWTASALWDASWPIILGLGLGAVIWRLTASIRLPAWLQPGSRAVQPGDLVVAEESVAVRGYYAAVVAAEQAQNRLGGLRRRLTTVIQRSDTVTRRAVATLEGRLAGWQSSGAAILLIVSIAALIVMWRWWL